MSNCSICLDSPKDTFVSQCGHSFCNKCILQWIMCHDECPLCRGAISLPSRNKTLYEDDEDVPNSYQFYLDGSASPQEIEIVHERVEDFIESFEDVDSESKYNWKDNNNGSYLVVRNGDYYLDMIFNIHKHNIIRNRYIIIGKVRKRVMEKQYRKQKKIKFNTLHNRHHCTYSTPYFRK
jgi:hypothetical protein